MYFLVCKSTLSENGVTKFLRRRDEKEKNRSPKPKIGDRDIGGSVVSGMGVSAFAGTKAGVIAGASGLQQKTYWICKKCGRKFRNPDELMAEVEAYQKRAKGFKIVGIIMSAM